MTDFAFPPSVTLCNGFAAASKSKSDEKWLVLLKEGKGPHVQFLLPFNFRIKH
jgi:hypothetical protein